MNINSSPQWCHGIGSSVILSLQMSMQVNKQMHGTRINGVRSNVDSGMRETIGEERSTTVVPKRDFMGQTFWRLLQKTGFNKIYWQKIVHWSSSLVVFCLLSFCLSIRYFFYCITSKNTSLKEVSVYLFCLHWKKMNVLFILVDLCLVCI